MAERFESAIGTHYARETMAPFELFVSGTSPGDEHGGAQVWHLTLWSDGRPPSGHKLLFDADRRCFLMGSRKDEIRSRVRAGFAADISYNPTIALAELIEETSVGEIGGLLQLALIDRGGGITLFPGYGIAASGGRLPQSFEGALFGRVGAFEVGLHRD